KAAPVGCSEQALLVGALCLCISFRQSFQQSSQRKVHFERFGAAAAADAAFNPISEIVFINGGAKPIAVGHRQVRSATRRDGCAGRSRQQTVDECDHIHSSGMIDEDFVMTAKRPKSCPLAARDAWAERDIAHKFSDCDYVSSTSTMAGSRLKPSYWTTMLSIA